MMGATLTLTLLEIILLVFGAVILGITIHFFIASRRSLNAVQREMEKGSMMRDEWKLRYFNDIEMKDKELGILRQQLQEAEENSDAYTTEAEEMVHENRQLRREIESLKNAELHQQSYETTIDELRRRNEQLRADMEEMKQALEAARQTPVTEKAEEKNEDDYLDQLQQAQKSLMEHNQKINQLLGNIDLIKEKEQKEREILHEREQLASELEQMRTAMEEKEKEMNTIRQKEHLTREMSAMLDSAYSEFGVLQEKIQKMESQLTASKMVSLELEDLKEQHLKVMRDKESLQAKAGALGSENQMLQAQLKEMEDNYREADFQRQQLQKKISYLEEINRDLQIVSDANKKLEGQLKRVGELESQLNLVSAERDQLAAERRSGQSY